MGEQAALSLPKGIVPTTSKDIRAALRLRYPAASHALLWEVADSTGSQAKRYADAVAVGLWPSHGHEVEGVEVKISRSDWLREKADHTKSQAVFAYCDRWWLACPKGMVQPDELPPTWGMLELVGETMRIKVKAPKLKPEAATRGFVASMPRRHAGCDDAMSAAAISAEVAKRTAQIRACAELEAGGRAQDRAEQATKAMEKLEAIKAATGIDLTGYKPSTEWIAAIQFLANADWNGFNVSKLRALRRQLVTVAESIDAFPLMAGDESE